MDIHIDNIYQGPFEHIGTERGAAMFESMQKISSADAATLHLRDLGVEPGRVQQNDFDVNTVSWKVNEAGELTGTAKFLAVSTHDIIKATLSGRSPSPAKGANFRRADVSVTFDGGTGIYRTAKGKAKVVAKLYENGLSVGHIQGTVSVG